MKKKTKTKKMAGYSAEASGPLGFKFDESFDMRAIEAEKVTPPKSAEHKYAVVLHNVLSEDECKRLIEATEERGYERALLNVGGGRQVYRPDVRNNFRCMCDDVDFCKVLYERVARHLPQQFKGARPLELNERLRFLRYDAENGEYFAPHFDGEYRRSSNGDRSMITLQLYLNGGFEGGATTFLRDYGSEDGAVPIVPAAGKVLLFEHRILHEGSLLKSGRKYALRTDVMMTKRK
jgi:predicted 2-oxoglutarate/Fe(II)-dependent dioxygenase YbiX